MKTLYLYPILLAMTFTACKEKKEFLEISNELKPKKDSVEKVSRMPKYSFDDQLVLRSYFRPFLLNAPKLKQLMISIASRKLSRSQQVKLTETLENACRDLVLSKPMWIEINRKCQYEGYFLCSEEIRAYPEIVETMMDQIVSLIDPPSSCLSWQRND